MRRSTMILGGILALLVTCAAVFLLGGRLSARVSAVTASASAYPRAYEAIAPSVEAGTVPQRFSDPLPQNPADCRLEDVTIALTNRGLFDAEWISVTVEEAPGDVAVYALTGEGSTVSARSTGTINLKLISAASGSGRRTYRIQYYVYGLKREIAVQADGES